MNGIRRNYTEQLGVIQQGIQKVRKFYDNGQLAQALNYGNELVFDIQRIAREIQKDTSEEARKSAKELTRLMNTLEALNEDIRCVIGGRK